MSGQGQPSRYTRSFNGMTGALIVTVLAVLAFVAWRGLWRSDVDNEPEAVDWQARVELAQQADLRVVHPRELPAGWTATSTELAAGDDPRWSLGVLTDDGRFVGIRQQDTSVTDLVELYVDEDAEAGDDATVTVRHHRHLADLVRRRVATWATPPSSATRRSSSTARPRPRTSRPTSGC